LHHRVEGHGVSAMSLMPVRPVTVSVCLSLYPRHVTRPSNYCSIRFAAPC